MGSPTLREPGERPEARTIEKMIRSRTGRQDRTFALEPVLERLALGLWRSVRRLAGADGRVALQTTFARCFPDYRSEIEAGSLMSMFELGDASGPGLLVLDFRLADAAIEVLLGGGQFPDAPETATAAARAYTPADQAVVRGLVRLIIAELSRTLAAPGSAPAGLTGRLLQTETDPQLVTMGPPDGLVTVARFEVVLGPGGCAGTFDLVLPASFIESVGPDIATAWLRRVQGTGFAAGADGSDLRGLLRASRGGRPDQGAAVRSFAMGGGYVAPARGGRRAAGHRLLRAREQERPRGGALYRASRLLARATCGQNLQCRQRPITSS
jgi:flagellar motor switch protein FliM